MPYSNKENANHWFEFNDSSVKPIMPGTLEKGFGGNETSAYLLVYRQRKVETSRTGPVDIPDYWRAEVERLNRDDRAYRESYWKLSNQFEIYLEDVKTFFNVSDDHFVTYNDKKP